MCIEEIMSFLEEFSTATVCIRLLAAFVFGGLIGMERGRRGQAAGLRTHILVCMGAAMTVMTGLYAITALNMDLDPLRIGAQVISGIGFLGVGTILVTGRAHVRGLTTAAGLWTTAAIGLALGIGFYIGAAICTVLSVLTIVFMNRFENAVVHKDSNTELYIEISDITSVNRIVRLLSSEDFGLRNLEIKPARSGILTNVGVEALLRVKRGVKRDKVMDSITEIPEIMMVIDCN